MTRWEQIAKEPIFSFTIKTRYNLSCAPYRVSGTAEDARNIRRVGRLCCYDPICTTTTCTYHGMIVELVRNP